MKILTEVCNQLSRLKKNNNNVNISKYRMIYGIQNVNVHQRTLKSYFKKCLYSPDQTRIFQSWVLSRGVNQGVGGGGYLGRTWRSMEEKREQTQTNHEQLICCFFFLQSAASKFIFTIIIIFIHHHHHHHLYPSSSSSSSEKPTK